MPLNIKGYSGDPMPLAELLAIYIHNFENAYNSLSIARQRLNNELYDAEYNENGNKRAYPDPYPEALTDAEEHYREKKERFLRSVHTVTERVTFPSLDVADDLAAVLGAQYPEKRFAARIERQGEVELLTVTDGGDICAVVDVDTKIDAESRRNTLENEKLVGGVNYALCDFLKKEDRDFYAYLQNRIRELLAAE